MVSSQPEPEWDEEQRELVLAEHIVRVNTGPNGEWLPEATDEASDPMKYPGFRYVPTVGTNWVEKERLDALDAHRKDLGEDPNMNGIFATVERVEY